MYSICSHPSIRSTCHSPPNLIGSTLRTIVGVGVGRVNALTSYLGMLFAASLRKASAIREETAGLSTKTVMWPPNTRQRCARTSSRAPAPSKTNARSLTERASYVQSKSIDELVFVGGNNQTHYTY